MKRTWTRDRYGFDRFNWYLSERQYKTLRGPRWLQVAILWLVFNGGGPRSAYSPWKEVAP